MVNPETLPILESSVLEDNIPDFDWRAGHSGVVLDGRQACKLNELYRKYLRDNAAVFADRFDLIAKRGMDNDQIYIDEKLFKRLQNR